jgi:signal transduction histidine kinase
VRSLFDQIEKGDRSRHTGGAGLGLAIAMAIAAYLLIMITL